LRPVNHIRNRPIALTDTYGSALHCFGMTDSIYPGEHATPQQLRKLAEEYRSAAMVLLSLGRRDPMSLAPFRLAAIHSIELYLNALLLACGKPHADIRGMQHDLSVRTDLAIALGMNLRRKTGDHLRKLNESREYLISRYAPEHFATLSQANRLEATLNEVALKTGACLDKQAAAKSAQRGIAAA